MVFEFKSTCGSAVSSTNNALGAVIMSTLYDPTDAAFSNKMQMENTEFTTSCKPSESFLHGIECMPAETVAPELFVNSVSSGSSTVRDPRFTTAGTFYIATSGMQAAVVIGELWVSYQIELLKPTLSYPTVVNTLNLYTTNPTSGNYFIGGTTILDTLGITAGAAESASALGAYSISGNSITFSDPRLSGRSFLVQVEVGATTVSTYPSVTSVTNGTVAQVNFSVASASLGVQSASVTFNPTSTNTWTLNLAGPNTTGTVNCRTMITLVV